MIISFDRKRKKKPTDVTRTHTMDAYQIFDEIEKEMNRVYQEICGKHDIQSLVKGGVANEADEMKKSNAEIDQSGGKATGGKTKIQ